MDVCGSCKEACTLLPLSLCKGTVDLRTFRKDQMLRSLAECQIAGIPELHYIIAYCRLSSSICFLFSAYVECVCNVAVGVQG